MAEFMHFQSRSDHSGRSGRYSDYDHYPEHDLPPIPGMPDHLDPMTQHMMYGEMLESSEPPTWTPPVKRSGIDRSGMTDMSAFYLDPRVSSPNTPKGEQTPATVSQLPPTLQRKPAEVGSTVEKIQREPLRRDSSITAGATITPPKNGASTWSPDMIAHMRSFSTIAFWMAPGIVYKRAELPGGRILFIADKGKMGLHETLEITDYGTVKQTLRKNKNIVSDREFNANGFPVEVAALKAGEKVGSQVAKGGARLPGYDPEQAKATSQFGPRTNPITQKPQQHKGIDINSRGGNDLSPSSGNATPVVSNGKVVLARPYGGGGLTVIVDHGLGITTTYMHNSRILVKVGDRVRRGQVIGISGTTGASTGVHIHFEVRENDVPQNPLGFDWDGHEARLRNHREYMEHLHGQGAVDT